MNLCSGFDLSFIRTETFICSEKPEQKFAPRTKVCVCWEMETNVEQTFVFVSKNTDKSAKTNICLFAESVFWTFEYPEKTEQNVQITNICYLLGKTRTNLKFCSQTGIRESGLLGNG